MTDFALGQAVTFNHVIVREAEWIKGEGTKRWWEPRPTTGEGFVVGWRTLSDGVIEHYREGNGYGGWIHVENRWIGKRYFRAYLITVDLRQNPIWALPEHMEARPS